MSGIWSPPPVLVGGVAMAVNDKREMHNEFCTLEMAEVAATFCLTEMVAFLRDLVRPYSEFADPDLGQMLIRARALLKRLEGR